MESLRKTFSMTLFLCLFLSCFVYSTLFHWWQVCAKHAFSGTVCGVGGGPLVDLNVSLFPTERCFPSCFYFSCWKDWCCKCKAFHVVYTSLETFPKSVQTEELWKHALINFFYPLTLKDQTHRPSSLRCLCLNLSGFLLSAQKKLQFHSISLTVPPVGILPGTN